MAEERQVLFVVDDDADFLDMTAGVLEGSGYRVERFGDPEEALRRMGEERPDLVISDLMMERFDSGFSFARRMKEGTGGRDVPVVIVTAASGQLGFDLSPRGPEDLAEMGADAWVDKPIDPARLLAVVRDLLAQSTTGETT